MSEPLIAAAEAIAGPLLKQAEQALAPEAVKVLNDLKDFVSGEADKLRVELPQVVEIGVAHLHNLGAAILGRYQAVMDHIDAHLQGTLPAPVAADPTAAPEAPTQS